jgi:cell wall-associated NlpC family hydrolase
MLSQPWFGVPDRVSALHHEAARWLGTPFVPNSAEPGPRGGVSCQKLVAELYFAVGFAARLPIPDAPMAHWRSNRESLVEQFMAGRADFVRLPGDPLAVLPGDMLGFTIGHTIHHSGVALGHLEFIHAIEGLGVTISQLSDPTWFGRLAAIWRPLIHQPSTNNPQPTNG